MRLTAELEQLTAEILDFSRLQGAIAGSEVLRRWADWSRKVLAEARVEWFSETDFKRRTGASGKWCRKHFPACESAGIARTRGGRREWHVSARPPVAPPASDFDGLVDYIASSFQVKAA